MLVRYLKSGKSGKHQIFRRGFLIIYYAAGTRVLIRVFCIHFQNYINSVSASEENLDSHLKVHKKIKKIFLEHLVLNKYVKYVVLIVCMQIK